MALACGRFRLALERPLVMGVVNVTPDSFSDGGRHSRPAAAIAALEKMAEEGADLVDIGGESTRPGASPVSAREELARIAPVLEAAVAMRLPVSVDTRKPEVMRAALAAGADMINDVNAFRAPGAIEAVAASGAALCVMHMLGEPATMQRAPAYRDVVSDVRDFLAARVQALYAAGVAPGRIVLDPGIGFGKTQEDNLRLLRSLGQIAPPGLPVLVGVSRKSLVGHLTGREAGERLAGSLGAAPLTPLAIATRSLFAKKRCNTAATPSASLKWWRMPSGP